MEIHFLHTNFKSLILHFSINWSRYKTWSKEISIEIWFLFYGIEICFYKKHG